MSNLQEHPAEPTRETTPACSKPRLGSFQCEIVLLSPRRQQSLSHRSSAIPAASVWQKLTEVQAAAFERMLHLPIRRRPRSLLPRCLGPLEPQDYTFDHAPVHIQPLLEKQADGADERLGFQRRSVRRSLSTTFPDESESFPE